VMSIFGESLRAILGGSIAKRESGVTFFFSNVVY
jgi:hypothetical protein